MRALLAAAGLLALTGSAAAGAPTTHTLRKSADGPIEAVAQDGNLVAWFSSSTRTCDAIHVLSPGNRDRTAPQPPSDSMTCHWDLTDGQPQLAVAARMSTALWTLHESGPTPVDWVLAAPIGGPDERHLDRLAHASNGTGEWLGGVAGSGRTLAYSWFDVEYVDKLACLSGGSCQQKIADGGIRLVTRTTETPLPGAGPALGLAASAGRIAYIPATTVRAGHPSGSANTSVEIVDATDGSSVGEAFVRGIPATVALSPHVLAVLTQRGPRDRISWFSADDATKLGSVLVSRRAATELAASDRLIVYRVNRMLYGVSTATGRIHRLGRTALNTAGLTLRKNRLVWAENHGGAGRLRALPVP